MDTVEEPVLYYVWEYYEAVPVGRLPNGMMNHHIRRVAHYNQSPRPGKTWSAPKATGHRSTEDCAWQLIGLNRKELM